MPSNRHFVVDKLGGVDTFLGRCYYHLGKRKLLLVIFSFTCIIEKYLSIPIFGIRGRNELSTY
jgi:hypothetical protein